MWREEDLCPRHSQTQAPILDNPPSFRGCHSHYKHQNDPIHYHYYLCSITISKKTEQNALSFQSLTIFFGSSYLLNINCCKKCRGS